MLATERWELFVRMGTLQAPERDFALPHLVYFLPFCNLLPFSPLSILFSFIHSLQRVATSTDLY